MSDITKVAEQLNQKVAKLNNERSRQMGMQESAKKQYETAISAYEKKYGVKLGPDNLQEEYNKVYKTLKTDIEVLKKTIESIENEDYKKVTTPNIDLEPEVEVEIPETVQEQPKEEETKQEQPKQEQPKAEVEITKTDETKEPMFGGIEIPSLEEEEEEEDSESSIEGLDFGGLTAPKLELEVEEVKAEEETSNKAETEGFDFSALIDGSLSQKQEPKKEEVKTQEKPASVKKPVKDLGLPTDFKQPTPPKFEGADTEEDDDFEEEESFTPEGWGKPKTNDDINKSFADILGSQGIKFGE